jgi:hypothetical protein
LYILKPFSLFVDQSRFAIQRIVVTDQQKHLQDTNSQTFERLIFAFAPATIAGATPTFVASIPQGRKVQSDWSGSRPQMSMWETLPPNSPQLPASIQEPTHRNPFEPRE